MPLFGHPDDDKCWSSFRREETSMKLRKILAAAAAVSLTAAPVAAQAAKVEGARSSEAIEGEEVGGSFLIPLLAIIAVVAAIVLVSGGDDEPTSP
jgi:hypothetical protein